MSGTCTESVVDQGARAWLKSVGWRVGNRAEIAPGIAVTELSGNSAP